MILTIFNAVDYNGVTMADMFKNINYYYLQIKDAFTTKAYSIRMSDRPETVAYKLYGDPNLYWVLFLVNGITDPFNDWVMSSNMVHDRAEYQYQWIGGVDAIDHYEDEKGRNWYNVKEYPDGSKNWYSLHATGALDKIVYFGTMVPKTVIETENAMNEDKRTIQVIPPENVRAFIEALVALIEVAPDADAE